MNLLNLLTATNETETNNVTTIVTIIAVFIVVGVLAFFFFKKKKRKDGTKKVKPTKEKDPSTMKLLDMPPLEWFYTETAKKEFEEYTSATAYANQDGAEKTIGGNTKLFEMCDVIVYQGCKRNSILLLGQNFSELPAQVIPQLFFGIFAFRFLTKASETNDIFKVSPLYDRDYKYFRAMLTLNLCFIARRYIFDEKGEPKEVKVALDYFQLISTEFNPLLKFVANFHAFTLKDSDPEDLLSQHFVKAMGFISDCIMLGDLNVLENNQWLLDKNSYFTSIGTPKTHEGFFDNAINNVTKKEYKDYFSKKLAQLKK